MIINFLFNLILGHDLGIHSENEIIKNNTVVLA